MKVITKDFITNVLSKDNAACASIRSGETVVFETYDCFTNQFLPEEATFENVVRKPGGSERTEFPEKILKRVPVKDGKAYYDGKVEIPVEPMIGVIGVAPAAEGVSTITPMDHGGNMDCTQIKKGAVLYLPVFVEGGLLSMGDFHAIMGDGEVEDCGLEIEGRATVHVDVVRNQYCVPYPMIETEDRLITIASAEDVEGAWRAATRQMFDFMREKIGMLLTMTGSLIICQTVNPMKTVRMELPRYITKGYGFYSIFGS